VAESPDLLIGDAERETAETELRGHYDAGRLTLDEYESRLGEVHAARTGADLREALRQLPDAKRPTLSPGDRRWRSLAYQYVLVNVIANLVWLATGADSSYWPRWVLLGTAILFLRRLLRPSRGSHRPPLPPEPPRPPELP
jgi:hypothetical protein